MEILADTQRETVMEEILKWDLLKKFMDSPGGKIIVNHIANSMSLRLAALMNSVRNDDERAMRVCVHELKAYESVMRELATIADKGMVREEEIKQSGGNHV